MLASAEEREGTEIACIGRKKITDLISPSRAPSLLAPAVSPRPLGCRHRSGRGDSSRLAHGAAASVQPPTSGAVATHPWEPPHPRNLRPRMLSLLVLGCCRTRAASYLEHRRCSSLGLAAPVHTLTSGVVAARPWAPPHLISPPRRTSSPCSGPTTPMPRPTLPTAAHSLRMESSGLRCDGDIWMEKWWRTRSG